MTSGTAHPAAAQDRVLWPVSAWFWALQFAVLNPILAVLLVTLYGAGDAETGLALGAYNVGGFLASLLIPAAADHRQDYLRPLLLCGASGIALVAALALVPSLPFAVIALVLLGGPPGVGSTLLFAQLRHSGAAPDRVVRTRAIVSFAWVAGPVLATAVTSAFSTRAALALLAGIAVVTIGFFAAHAVASGWVAGVARGAKGHAAALYLLAYYLGSSVMGSLGGWFWSAGGWPAVSGFVAAMLALSLLASLRIATLPKARGR